MESPASDQLDVGKQESVPGSQPEAVAGDVAGKAESSAAEGVNKPESVLDAVMNALGKKAEAEAPKKEPEGGESPPPEAKKEGEAETEAKAEDDGDVDGDAKGSSKKDAARRVHELLAERKDYLPRAKQFDVLQQFVQGHGISQPEFETSLQVLALSKTDPFAAADALEKIAGELRAQVGDGKLPDDLAEEVERGEISERRAKELARVRLREDYSQRRQVEQRQRDEQARQNEEAERSYSELAKSIGTAVTKAEAEAKANDPDFSRIRSLVEAKCVSLVRESPPESPEAAVKQFRDAVAWAKAEAKKLVGEQRRDIRPLPSGNSANAGPRDDGDLVSAAMANLSKLRGAA